MLVVVDQINSEVWVTHATRSITCCKERRKCAVAPPAELSTRVSVPPCRLIIPEQMANPSPIPFSFVGADPVRDKNEQRKTQVRKSTDTGRQSERRVGKPTHDRPLPKASDLSPP